MRTLSALGLFTIALSTSPSWAQPRDAAPSAPITPQQQQPQPQPAPPQSTCCCRTWSHGWQYSWAPAPTCTQSNGSCVSPDHC